LVFCTKHDHGRERVANGLNPIKQPRKSSAFGGGNAASVSASKSVSDIPKQAVLSSPAGLSIF
jgi:hypothetical protein